MDKHAMHTIALVSRKGGTGKSTLAIGLAVAAIESGHRVCLLEADPLATVSNWRRRRTSTEPTSRSSMMVTRSFTACRRWHSAVLP
jgi:cellulose biosynthesis protein BcsQ